jgi:hypothetical protein
MVLAQWQKTVKKVVEEVELLLVALHLVMAVLLAAVAVVTEQVVGLVMVALEAAAAQL